MVDERHDRVRRFYRENRQGLYTYALSLTRDREAAEDAVQAAIFRLLRRAMLPRDLRPYVYRCVRNAAVDGYRRQGTGKARLLDPEAAGPERSDPTRVRLLEQCLDCLPKEERETVVLKALNGLTFREIATVRKATLSTVASRYRRGLEKMRRRLEEEK
jgi:RNA polymerase sigma-70 factor (ECF subfamily)